VVVGLNISQGVGIGFRGCMLWSVVRLRTKQAAGVEI
jgi:hypothetical protein